MTNKVEIISILIMAVLGLLYSLFFMGRDPVLLIIFGLQIYRSGMALRGIAKAGM